MRISRLTYEPTTFRLDAALDAQRSFWRISGVFTVLMIILWAMLIVYTVASGPVGIAPLIP